MRWSTEPPAFDVVRLLSPGSGRIELFDTDLTNGRIRRVSALAVRPGEGRLTEPTADAHPGRRELVFMPHTCRSQYPSGSAQLSGFTPFGQRTVAPVVRLGSSALAVSSLLAVFVADDGAQLTTFEK